MLPEGSAGYLGKVANGLRLLIVTGLAAAPLLVQTPAVSVEPENRVLYRATETAGPLAIDRSEYHNDGLLRGGVIRKSGVYRFHALSNGRHRYDRIRAPFDPSFNPKRAPFSYGARLRVRPSAEWSHSEMAVLRHGDTDTPGGDYKLELKKTKDGEVTAFCAIHDGDGDGVGYVRGHGELETIADGDWHTVICSRVDKDTVSLTIDDHVTERPVTGDLGSVVGGDPLLIGCQLAKDEIHRREQFVGAMDDITVRVG